MRWILKKTGQSLADADGGNDVFAVHDGLPRGRSAADNEV
jgi:hypothetical protein